MVDLHDVDLADLAIALEDHSDGHAWWFDPASGRLTPLPAGPPGEHEGRMIAVEPLPTAVGYGDMEDFAAQVRDASTRERLARALTGRGAFRRFKDALLAYPELRRSWFAFHDARSELRALEWLAARRLVEPAAVATAIARRPEPALEPLHGVLDAEGVARRTALDLRRLYRDRLRRVLLIGPWARGDAHPDAALELVVVLDAVPDRWEEKARMDGAMWRHSIRNDTVVTEFPVTEAELAGAPTPLLARVLAEGVRIA